MKPSPVNPALSGPSIGGHQVLKPDIKLRRPPRRPKVARVSPFAGAVQLLDAAPVKPKPKPRGRRGLLRAPPAEAEVKANTGVALGVTAGVVAVTAATMLGLKRLDKKE